MTRASDTARLVSGGAVFNEASNDVDFRVESNGRTHALMVDAGNNSVLFGDLQTAQTNGGTNSSVQIEGTDGTASLSIFRNGDDANGSAIFLCKSRGTALESNTVVQANDEVGKILFVAGDGTDRASFVGGISCAIDGNPGANDPPGSLSFFVVDDGSNSLREVLRLGGGGGSNTLVDQNGPLSIGRDEPSGSVSCITFNNDSTSVTSVAGQCFRIMGDGDVENTNNSYGSISDIKLKENIVDASSQWDDIKALKVKNFSYKKDKLDKPNMIGVIAQDVEAAGMGGLITERYDNDGGQDKETMSKAVKYSVLYMKAVKALQEAMTRIETLEAEVAKLKG